MKRALFIALGLLAVAGIAAFGVAVARPDLMPAWARITEPQAGEAEHSADAGLYCKEHGVPEKFCTLCHQELKEKLMLCKEHGDIPEDICTLCHPEVAKKYNIEDVPARPARALLQGMRTGEPRRRQRRRRRLVHAHNQPEGPAPSARAGSRSSRASTAVCRQPLPIVRFASAELAETIGIETAEVTEEEHAHELMANAETAYDANRYAEISPRVAGFLREVRVDLGQAVQRATCSPSSTRPR